MTTALLLFLPMIPHSPHVEMCGHCFFAALYVMGSEDLYFEAVFIDNVADGSTKKRQRQLGQNAAKTEPTALV